MPQDSSSDSDWRRYWAVVLKRKYIALSVALFVISAFTLASFLWPKTYEASSTVFIAKGSIIDPLIQGVGISGTMDDSLRQLRDSIVSRNTIERAIKRINLGAGAKARVPEALVEKIKKNLKVEVNAKEKVPDLFTISYTGRDPKGVCDVVNGLVNEYIEEKLSSRKTDVSEAYEFISNQLLEYKKRLDNSDRSLREFREKNPTLVPQSETAVLHRLESFQSAKIEAEIKVKELTRKRENLQKQLSGEKELTVAFVSGEGSLQGRLNQLNNQLMVLMTKYTGSYPEVIRVKNEIEELKKQIAQAKDSQSTAGAETAAINPIYQQLREELARTDAEIESLKARGKELSRQQQEAQGMLGVMPREQEEWSKLQRDRNVYQKLYDDLSQKLENARVSSDLERANKAGTFKIVDPAIVPQMPIQPNRVKMILLGIVLGIAMGLGTVLGIEHVNPSFKDEASVESSTKLPVLATIPQVLTETDMLSAKRLERKVFIATGSYFFLIVLILAEEFLSRYMGIKVINF